MTTQEYYYGPTRDERKGKTMTYLLALRDDNGSADDIAIDAIDGGSAVTQVPEALRKWVRYDHQPGERVHVWWTLHGADGVKVDSDDEYVDVPVDDDARAVITLPCSCGSDEDNPCVCEPHISKCQ